MLYGLLGSLPTVTVMLALSGDGLAVAVKVTAMVQVELGDAVSVGMQVPPVTVKSVALGPLMLSLNDSGNPERLVTVTVLVFVGAFDVSVPYASVARRTVAGSSGW